MIILCWLWNSIHGHRAVISTSKDADFQFIFEHEEHLLLQQQMHHPITLHEEMMECIMYFHQALYQHGAIELIKALVKEVNGHMRTRDGSSSNTQGTNDFDIIPLAWSMLYEQNLITNEIAMYKFCLNICRGNRSMVLSTLRHKHQMWHSLTYASPST